MLGIFEKYKKKKQFQAYCNGYSAGYQRGVEKCRLNADGRVLQLRSSDITIQSQFCKRPKAAWRYFPWYAGFEYGYTEALSWYNAGEDPKLGDGDESINDIIERLRKEFDKEAF